MVSSRSFNIQHRKEEKMAYFPDGCQVIACGDDKIYYFFKDGHIEIITLDS